MANLWPASAFFFGFFFFFFCENFALMSHRFGGSGFGLWTHVSSRFSSASLLAYCPPPLRSFADRIARQSLPRAALLPVHSLPPPPGAAVDAHSATAT
ncbi:hypothetical protein LZ32DRAFT_207866 [Colletotrichum eremochloae]|nr:hypothetical protein LZ32DRAFT_207866 [Colletotrichum eremochloae]